MRGSSKQASLFAQLINKDIISMNNIYKGRLPENPIRPNIAGRFAKRILNLKKKRAQCRNTNRLVINRELY